MHQAHLPDGPEQEKRDASFGEPVMPPPSPVAPVVAEKKQLKDFDPPSDALGTVERKGTHYIIGYDVLTHVSDTSLFKECVAHYRQTQMYLDEYWPLEASS